MGRTKRSSWLSFAALVVSWSISAQAQTFQGSFAGTVMDDTGAVIPHALVTAAEQNTGLVHRTATLDDGSYEIATT